VQHFVAVVVFVKVRNFVVVVDPKKRKLKTSYLKKEGKNYLENLIYLE
jgi:hypothetical protein